MPDRKLSRRLISLEDGPHNIRCNMDCPHCGTRAAFFAGQGYFYYDIITMGDYRHFHQIYALYRCSICCNGVAALCGFVSKDNNPRTNINIVFGTDETPILASYPDEKEESAPKFVPENVERFYLQGLSSLGSSSWDAAGSMFRKTLDTATKAINTSLTERRLVDRIDKLFDSGGLTKQLQEWAHEIRMDGNDAVHDDDPFTENDAKELKDFTEIFLQYTFSMPGKLEERKKLRAQS